VRFLWAGFKPWIFLKRKTRRRTGGLSSIQADQAAFMIGERGGAVSIAANALTIVLSAGFMPKHLEFCRD
jgi:hypothetical protein